jgi:hypothetical protein
MQRKRSSCFKNESSDECNKTANKVISEWNKMKKVNH